MKLVTLWQLHFDGRGSNKAKYAIVYRIRSEDVNVKVCLNHRHQAIGEKNGRGSLGENQKSPKKLLWKEGSHQAGSGSALPLGLGALYQRPWSLLEPMLCERYGNELETGAGVGGVARKI